jgi:hypothetical protein
VKNKALIVVVVLLFIAPAHARMHRSSVARYQFANSHACPATGQAMLPCPGYQIDHVIPLKCGGADDPSNMQWLSIHDHKAKTKREAKLCRRKQALTISTGILIHAFLHLHQEHSGDPLPYRTIFEDLRLQVVGAREVLVDQVPEHLRQRCAAPFQTLETVLGVLATSHPEAIQDDLEGELGVLTEMIRAKPPPPNEQSA